jgi:hypothetical protein
MEPTEKPEYVIHVTNELHAEVNDIYEALIDGEISKVESSCKELIRLAKEILKDIEE